MSWFIQIHFHPFIVAPSHDAGNHQEIFRFGDSNLNLHLPTIRMGAGHTPQAIPTKNKFLKASPPKKVEHS